MQGSKNGVQVHPTAVVSAGAKLHPGVVVGPFCVIGEGVELGEGCRLSSHVVLDGDCVFGRENIFYSYASLGLEPPDIKFKGEASRLVVGDRNTFRESVTVHKGTESGGWVTKIGSDNLFMAYSHVAHDCVVGNDNVFANNAGIAGHVNVGNNITIGALTTVHQFCKLGDFCFVGMNTSINMDIPAYLKVAADPARVIGLNTVGMTRNGIEKESMSLIKKAYKLVYKKNLKINAAINEMKKLNHDSQNIFLDTFIASIEASERGILR